MPTPILIEPDQAAALDEPHVFIDTRAPADYAAGHIADSVSIREVFTTLAMSSGPGLATLRDTFALLFGAAGLSGAERAIVYEDSMDTGNGQSCRGYFLLRYLGYSKVSVLHGGLQGWLAAGYPVTTRSTTARPALFPTAVDERLMVTRDEMLAALGDARVTTLDVRDEPEWLGQASAPPGSEDPSLRKGRIPGARPLPWRRMLSGPPGQTRFRSAAEVLELCRGIGLDPRSRVFIYCFKGARAASTLVALERAGFTDVRNYFASWNEWGRAPELPIEEANPSSRLI